MGCDISSLKSKKAAKDDKNATRKDGAKAGKTHGKSGSLDIPVPEKEPIGEEKHVGAVICSLPNARSSTTRREPTESNRNPSCPMELQTIIDEMSNSTSMNTSYSTPQLFHISPTIRDEVEPGTWEWWRQELRRERVTRDGYSCVQLRDISNRLTCQHDDNPESVDLDLSNCYMERTAPTVLGRMLASTQLKEIRWITSLRLDGNYFTDSGFGAMLVIMSAENESQTILPLLRQLYLNNMNLDRSSVTGLLAYLFPVDYKATQDLPADPAFRIAGSCVAQPSGEFVPGNKQWPKVPLFPSLSVLSLSDNPGLGTSGLIQILRHLIAVHYEPFSISVVDLSRCGFDNAAVRFFREFFDQVPKATKKGCYPVVPRRFVLSGNQHGISDPHEIYCLEITGVQLVL